MGWTSVWGVQLSVSLLKGDGGILICSFFGFFINFDSILLHKNTYKKRKKELTQYPAILASSHAWLVIIHFYTSQGY